MSALEADSGKKRKKKKEEKRKKKKEEKRKKKKEKRRKKTLPHRGLEPASVFGLAFQSDCLPTE